jgi:hypothetical protein
MAAGICGLVGAVLWFFSARRLPAPTQAAYRDVSDNRDSPFQKNWKCSALLNQWAAFFTGMAALLMSMPLLLND